MEKSFDHSEIGLNNYQTALFDSVKDTDTIEHHSDRLTEKQLAEIHEPFVKWCTVC